MQPKTHTCSYCQLELPTARTLQLHSARCLVRLRRIGQPETAWQTWMRLVRGEKAVRP